MGYECWKVIDGKFQKMKIVDDKTKYLSQDKNSMRSFVYTRFSRFFTEDNANKQTKILKAKQVQRQMVQKEIARIERLEGLGIMDPHYVPYYEQSQEVRKSTEGNVTEDEVRRFEAQFKMLKSSQEGRKVDGGLPRTVSCILDSLVLCLDILYILICQYAFPINIQRTERI